jgi:hypothetical protein
VHLLKKEKYIGEHQGALANNLIEGDAYTNERVKPLMMRIRSSFDLA